MPKQDKRRKSPRDRTLEGNTGHRAEPTPRIVPRDSPQLPSRPEFLPPEGKREWTRITKALGGEDILTPADRGILSVYCAAWASWRNIYKQLQALPEAERYVSYYANGNPFLNPLVSALDRATNALLKAADKIGATPAARHALDPEQGDEKKDALTDWLSNRGRPGSKGRTG